MHTNFVSLRFDQELKHSLTLNIMEKTDLQASGVIHNFMLTSPHVQHKTQENRANAEVYIVILLKLLQKHGILLHLLWSI